MHRPPVDIPKDLKTVARIFGDAGYQCWLVGGAVRDGLLKRGSDDFDLATDAEPEEVVKLFRRTVPTGIKHGTVTILLGSHQFETTTFRRDGDYSDGRRPDRITYSKDIREDLARRDFTINAIAWNLIDGELLDPHGGRSDLQKRIIRAIGKPKERFEEDSLRSIRACRFSAQLEFTVEAATLQAISGTLDRIPALSVERIWEELKKILRSPAPSRAFRLFQETGLLSIILPDLEACVGVGQKGRHTMDVFHHSLAACDAAPPSNLAVRAAALFHDIGKPPTREVRDDGEITFRHDIVGAEITQRILEDYRASNAEKDCITRLVRHHMFHYTSDWTDAATRRFIIRVGLDILDDLISLRVADSKAISPDKPAPVDYLRELLDRVDAVLESRAALSIRDLDVDGRDLMNDLGMTGGPAMGSLLNHLLDCVLEDPTANRRDRLLDMAERWLEVYSPKNRS